MRFMMVVRTFDKLRFGRTFEAHGGSTVEYIKPREFFLVRH